MEKKVSVIVPVYRTLEWLARCVQSITGQTYKNLEIILKAIWNGVWNPF